MGTVIWLVVQIWVWIKASSATTLKPTALCPDQNVRELPVSVLGFHKHCRNGQFLLSLVLLFGCLGAPLPLIYTRVVVPDQPYRLRSFETNRNLLNFNLHVFLWCNIFKLYLYYNHFNFIQLNMNYYTYISILRENKINRNNIFQICQNSWSNFKTNKAKFIYNVLMLFFLEFLIASKEPTHNFYSCCCFLFSWGICIHLIVHILQIGPIGLFKLTWIGLAR